MNKNLKQLIQISNLVGNDPSLVRGVGGNTSVKTDDGKYMFIKASGTSLKDMAARKGWRRLRTEKVQAILGDKSLVEMEINKREFEIVNRLRLACDDNVTDSSRPSVESPLHVVLYKYVIHIHALSVLAYACSKKGKEKIINLLKDEKTPPLWIPYANPGYCLGMEVSRTVRSFEKRFGCKPAIMIIQKHGLLVTADSQKEVLRLVRKVIARCNCGLKSLKTTAIKKPKPEDIKNLRRTIKKALLEVAGQTTMVSHFVDKTVSDFLIRTDAEKLLKAPMLTTDESCLVHNPIIWLEKFDYKTIANKINSTVTKFQKPPIAFLVKDVGLFIAASKKTTPVLRDIVIGSLFVRGNAQNVGGINPLNKKQRDFIVNWEAQTLRVKVAGSKKKKS
ncbi:MAG: class II aldolase/adducin family protein [Planctomycetes bacterium]|nr:class II aldolase/adducin family protein [Planctomycetota bacterium]